MATMGSATADAAAAALGMPRFEDGTVDMRELPRRPAERVIDGTMAPAASAAAEDAGTTGNGFGGRRLATRVGTLELRMPRLGAGSHLPSGIIERHSRTDEAVCAAVAEVHASGAPTRRVAGTARALGADRLSEGQAGRIRVGPGAGVEDLSGRESDGLGGLPCLWMDATHARCRDGGHVASAAVVAATGRDAGGDRRAPGFGVAGAGPYGSWPALPRRPGEGGMRGVPPVASGAHRGPVGAIQEASQGAAWRRRVAHLTRDCRRAAGPKARRARVARLPPPAFRARGALVVQAACRLATARVASVRPGAAATLEGAGPGAPACLDLPASHWERPRASNAQGRAGREAKRRPRVVQAFPSRQSPRGLAGAVMGEVGEPWRLAHHFSQAEVDGPRTLVGRGRPGGDATPTAGQAAKARGEAAKVIAAAEVEMEKEAAWDRLTSGAGSNRCHHRRPNSDTPTFSTLPCMSCMAGWWMTPWTCTPLIRRSR